MISWRPPRRPSAILGAVVVAAAVVLALPAALETLGDGTDYSTTGEALLHHSPAYHAGHLPLSDVFASVSFSHDGGGVSTRTLNVLSFLATAVLCWAWAPSPSPLLFASSWRGAGDHPVQLFFAVLVLLCGCLLAWRARKPSWRRSLALGLAFGVAMLCRSTLALFPPLLILYEWNFLYGRSLKRYWRHLVALGLTPYLLLLPWTYLNWRLHGRFVLFENGEANGVIATAALGLHAYEGPWQALTGLSENAGAGQVLAWAVRRIVSHPLVYLEAYLGRLGFVFGLHPLLCVLAGASLWVHRRREEHRQLGLLMAYFVLVHCLMSVVAIYFVPLWPLASVAAGALIDRALFPQTASETSRRLSRWVLAGALCLALTAGLYAESVVVSYALEPHAAPSTLERDPDAWLLAQRAWRHLDEKDYLAAQKDFSAALARRPQDDELGLWLAWVEMLRGHPRSLSRWRISQNPSSNRIVVTWHLLKAHACLRRHDGAGMRSELESATAENRRGIYIYGDDPDDRRATQVLQAHAGRPFIDTAKPALVRMPPQEGITLLDALAEANPSWPELSEERSDLALRRDPPEELRRVAMKYQEAGAYAQALPLFRRLVKEHPQDAARLADLAVCEYGGGRPEAALRELRSAIRLDPGFLPAYLSLSSIYEERGQYEEALTTLERAPTSSPAADGEMLKLLDEGRRRLRQRLVAKKRRS